MIQYCSMVLIVILKIRKKELFMTYFEIFIRCYQYNKYYFFLSYFANLHYASTRAI